MNRKIRRYFLAEFKRDKRSYKSYFYNMILNANQEDIKKLLESIERDREMLSKMGMMLCPMSLAELSSNKIVFNSEISIDNIEEIFIDIISLFSNKLNRYLTLKSQYEGFLFKNEYEKAYSLLERIEAEICVSIWSCSHKMMLKEKLEGLEEHKKVMSEFLKVTKSNILINTLIEFRSFSVESNNSYIAYQDRVKDFLNLFKNDEILHNYLNYKLNLEDDFDKQVLKIVMQFDSQFSLIDLYECFIEYINISNLYNEVNLGNLLLIEKKIIDYRLTNNILLNDYSKLKEYVKENNFYYILLDQYTKGNYAIFIKNIQDYLDEFPQDFQAVLLYIKACINCGQQINGNIIYKDIYNIYTLNEQVNSSILNMYQYLKEYQGTTWEIKIKGFISRKITLKDTLKYNYISSINDFRINPNFVENFSDNERRYNFLINFEDECLATTELYKYRNGDSLNIPNTILDNNRKNLFTAEYQIQNKIFDESIDLLLRMKKQLKPSDLYNLERVNRKLVVAYIGKKDYLSVIELIVKSYLKNENMIRRINLTEILDLIKDIDNILIKSSIYNVLFTYICDKNNYKRQRIAYSNFMDLNRFKSVLDIVNSNIDNMALVFFLDKICVQHLLKRQIVLNQGDSDEIRIDILRHLMELDVSNKKIYYEEITSITQQKSIKDRIKQINQSRVYVDVENIKKENEYILKESFNRYLSVKDFDDDLLAIDVTSNEYLNDLRKVVDDISEKINEKIRANPSYSQTMVILRGIITRIAEEFLFNDKYGLNTFLSSRIRHGYCKNQLVSVFRDNNLLSKKKFNHSDEYEINEYWDAILPRDSQDANLIKQELSLFTLKIEKMVEEVKSNWLSIKYKEDTNGFLDFSNCVNGCLVVIESEQIVDFEAFFSASIDFLWGFTQRRFEELRLKITDELMEYFLMELSKLEVAISSVKTKELENYTKQICSSINLCKSQVNGTITEFSNVFYKKDVYYRDFSMSDLIDTCLEISNKLNSNFGEIRLARLINDNNLYDGKVFPYFVDMINILINNAMEHSGLSSSDLSISIIIEPEKDPKVIDRITSELKITDQDFLRIAVINNISSTINEEIIKSRLESIFYNMKNREVFKKYIQIEGGTGLYKLNKTLIYHLPCASGIFYDINNNQFRLSIVIGTKNIMIGG